MKSSAFIFIILICSVFSGCISDEQQILEDSSNDIPDRLSFSAPVLNGTSNITNFNLEEYVSMIISLSISSVRCIFYMK